MKKPILALVPSAYKTQKVYSVLPVNGDGDFDFFRFGDATRIKENGLIENIVGSNNPRLNWSGECPSLLMEGTSTNLQVYSEGFDNGAWTKSRTTITANDTISPNGELTADKITGDGTGASYVFDGISLTNGNTYTISIFVKPIINISSFAINVFGGVGIVYFDLINKTINIPTGDFTSAKIEDYGNGWLRCSGTLTLSSTTGTKNIGYGLFDFNGDQFYLFGVQVEESNYPTSYIKTEGSIFTRSEEYRITTSLSGQTQFDKNKGVVFIDVNPFELNTGQSSAISLQDGGYNILLFDFKPNNILNFFINNAPAPGAVSYDYSHSGGRIKAAILWSNGKYRLFANGQLLNSYNTSIEFSQLDSFQFNSYFGTYDFQGKVFGVQVFDELLSDDEIKKMTEL